MPSSKVRTSAGTRRPRKARKVSEVARVGDEWGDIVRERVRQLRDATGSNRALARQLGISQSLVTRWLSEGLLSAQTLKKLQQIDVSADYLLGADVPAKLSARLEVGALARKLTEHVLTTWKRQDALLSIIAEVLGGFVDSHRDLIISTDDVQVGRAVVPPEAQQQLLDDVVEWVFARTRLREVSSGFARFRPGALRAHFEKLERDVKGTWVNEAFPKKNFGEPGFLVQDVSAIRKKRRPTGEL